MLDTWETEGGTFIKEKYNLMSECPISVKHKRKEGALKTPMWQTIHQDSGVAFTWKKTLRMEGGVVPRTEARNRRTK